MRKATLKPWRFLVFVLSSEWVLTKLDVPNGGAAILLRTTISSVLVYLLAISLMNLIDPGKSWEFSWLELRLQMTDRFAWFGVIFGVIYTALYARYSSQWTYLANLYNEIKKAEAARGDEDVLSEWKAGFIEDAQNLHLACKSSIVTIVNTWANESKVVEMYIKNTPGGKVRLDELMKDVEFSLNLVEKKYKQK